MLTNKLNLIAGSIVGSNQLREKYLPLAFVQEQESLQNKFEDQYISVTIDETSMCGRSAVNVLFSFGKETKLVKTNHLNQVDSSIIAQLTVSTLQFYNIPFEKVILFISDNASYMRKRIVFFPLFPYLKHNGCLAHIYNLIWETWVNFEKFKGLDNIVTNLKKIFHRVKEDGLII